jgi:chromosome partitioning protein
MPVIVVANPKGGVGKSTLSTNIAGYLASQGHKVMLGDVDRQQSSRLWLSLRPAQARAISPWEIDDAKAKPPKGTTHMVLDTPAGLHGKKLKPVLGVAQKMVIPVQPSVFDIFAMKGFLDELAEERAARKLDIGIVGMRVDPRTLAAEQLRQFTQTLGIPVVAWLRDTQNYVHLAARGLTLFDVAASRVQKDLEQWQDLCQWLDKA